MSNRSFNIRPRLIGLDFLRFFAASFVVLDHSSNFVRNYNFLYRNHGISDYLLGLLFYMGPTAVYVFFVLSGFLVSGLLFQEIQGTGTVSPGRFLIRRGFKIYPAFWVMFAATVAWTLSRGSAVSAKHILAELFYLQNYTGGLSFQTWSLAVEEHFYFLLAGIFLFARWRTPPGQKLSLAWLPDLCLAVAVFCLLARAVVLYTVTNPILPDYFIILHGDHAVLDSLFFGVLLSWYWHNLWDEKTKEIIIRAAPIFFGLGIFLLQPAWSRIFGNAWYRLFSFVLLYLGSGALLLSSLALDRYEWSQGFLQPIAWLGRYSYSVYLWHLLVGYVLFPHLSIKLETVTGWILNSILYFVIVWIVGILLAHLIEFPVIRCRDRWFPSLITKPILADDGNARQPQATRAA